eukprot:GFKZ01012248.1.p1 GENE.GFKZ01012248.1~~GFKZ01012248.1.p1  ORF type:complete len:243 (-),score=30.38 GFKZ01012248.1:488-1216(-)
MNWLVSNSDTMLRPDVGLLLPTLGVYLNSWPVVLLATMIQPLKWESGCGCIVKLCERKRQSARIAAVVGVVGVLYYLGFGVRVLDMYGVVLGGVGAVALSRESVDTRVLKAGCMLLAGLLPTGWMLVGVGVLGLVYGYVMGWQVRGKESVDVLAGNRMWLVTKDGKLAKRVNNAGEFHLEYVVEGKKVLVGNGRLVGNAGMKLKSGLEMARFVQDKGNMETLQACVENESVIVKGDEVGIQQ